MVLDHLIGKFIFRRAAINVSRCDLCLLRCEIGDQLAQDLKVVDIRILGTADQFRPSLKICSDLDIVAIRIRHGERNRHALPLAEFEITRIGCLYDRGLLFSPRT